MPLTASQISDFNEQGFLIVENAITATQLAGLQVDFKRWVEESRQYQKAYGEIADGRARFDLEPGHSQTQPALRRVSSPQEVSEAFLAVMRDNKALDALAQLYGPNLKFNNAKINAKMPGAATQVKYHQDFVFEPHSNDDLATVLIFLDDVDANNGPLEIVPGSHKGPLYEHWHDGVFTGAIDDKITQREQPKAITCTGPAGTACIMHTRALHGSATNFSNSSRTVYIVEYAAEDAIPLIDNHIPSGQEGEIVRGVVTGRIRSSVFDLATPEYPQGTSFFSQQVKHGE